MILSQANSERRSRPAGCLLVVNLHLSHRDIQTLRLGISCFRIKSLTFSIIQRVGGEDTLARRKARGSVDDRNGPHRLQEGSPTAVLQAYLLPRNAGPRPLSRNACSAAHYDLE